VAARPVRPLVRARPVLSLARARAVGLLGSRRLPRSRGPRIGTGLPGTWCPAGAARGPGRRPGSARPGVRPELPARRLTRPVLPRGVLTLVGGRIVRPGTMLARRELAGQVARRPVPVLAGRRLTRPRPPLLGPPLPVSRLPVPRWHRARLA